MPFAPVDDAHTELFYQDSGVPILNDRPYTTLVAVHGHSWNGHIFTRLLPLAQASHIRLVLLNRRGYAGSTSYGDDETAGVDPDILASEHTETLLLGHSAFLQRRGVEIARFLAWYIENEGIPPISGDENETAGGISVMGWSLGNETTMSFLAFANTFDPTLMRQLEKYIRRIIVYDPPYHALGYRAPTNAYNPLFDLTIPVEQRGPKYASWVSSYFTHSPIALDLDSSLREPLGSLEQHTPNPSKEPTLTHISSTDIQAGLETDTERGDEFLLLPQARPAHEDVRLRAVFGDLNETSVPVALPRVGISYIWCTQSVWETVLAARLLKQELAKPSGYHYPVRRVKFFALEGNHFAHWDKPLKTFAMLAAAME